jgi:hypothetical protein
VGMVALACILKAPDLNPNMDTDYPELFFVVSYLLLIDIQSCSAV